MEVFTGKASNTFHRECLTKAGGALPMQVTVSGIGSGRGPPKYVVCMGLTGSANSDPTDALADCRDGDNRFPGCATGSRTPAGRTTVTGPIFPSRFRDVGVTTRIGSGSGGGSGSSSGSGSAFDGATSADSLTMTPPVHPLSESLLSDSPMATSQSDALAADPSLAALLPLDDWLVDDGGCVPDEYLFAVLPDL